MSVETVARTRLIVIPPSAIRAPLRAALRGAARARGLRVVDALSPDGQAPGDEVLVICAYAGGADMTYVSRWAVVLGDPDHAVGALDDWLALSAGDAIVFASRCYAHAAALGREAGGAVVSEAALRADAAGALDTLLAALDLTPPVDTTAAVLAEFRSALDVSLAAALAAPDLLARDALAIYRGGEHPPQAWWSRELFQWGDDPSCIPPPVMDVTGAARSLVTGPYLSLPPGTWRVTAVLDADEDAARRFYLVSLGSGPDFSHEMTFRLRPGRNELSVTHRFAAVGPAEFALGLPFGGFHGEVMFLGVKLEAVEEAA